MSLPNLEEIIGWFKERMRPKDQTIGNGIADWTITAEYVPDLIVDGTPAYGALCSPGDKTIFPSQEDVDAKRAHFLIRPPSDEKSTKELRVTFFHECNHILQSMFASPGGSNRTGMENQTHSMDNFLSLLTPEEITLFARHIPTEAARAYRAEEGSMPDAVPDPKKEPDKGTEKPAMAEGAPRDVATIQGDIAKAALSGLPCEELCKELALALVAAGSAAGNGPSSTKEPIVPPTVGMTPEQAYARKIAENTKESIEAIVEANTHLTDSQKAMARKQSSAKDARELVSTYPRAANQNDQAKLGMPKDAKAQGDKAEKPMARAIREAGDNPALRRILGIGAMERDGIYVEPGGGILVYTDGTEQLAHQKSTFENRKRGAA